MGRLTSKRLRELLDFDEASGEFRWKTRTSNRVKVGDVAGRDSGGYVRIAIDSVAYPAHRLSLMWVTGKYPDRQVRHLNGLRHDNRPCNLRITPRPPRRRVRAPDMVADEGAVAS
jgi:hypothetical protein